MVNGVQSMRLAQLKRCLVLLGISVALAQQSAWAEKSDRSKAVHLEADRILVDDAKQVNIFEGNVILKQGTLTLKADKIIVKQDGEGFQHGIASGNPASFRQKRDSADEYVEGFAERIEYDARADRAELFNKARLKRALDEVQGNYILYDGKTEFYRVTGGGKEASNDAGSGRVRAVIQPRQSATPATATTPPKPGTKP